MIPDKIAVFDTETTGVDTESVRIVTAHVLVMNADGRVFATHDWVFDPGVEIPAKAASIHGYTTARARYEGTNPAPGVREIADVLAGLQAEGLPLSAFNASYDFTLLDRELRRHGHSPLPALVGPVIDPYVIDRAIDPRRSGLRKLVNMAETYRVTIEENAHTASADCLMTGRIAFKILAELGRRPRLDESVPFLEYLHMRQIEWHAEQQRTHQNPRTGWPVQPYQEAKNR